MLNPARTPESPPVANGIKAQAQAVSNPRMLTNTAWVQAPVFRSPALVSEYSDVTLPYLTDTEVSQGKPLHGGQGCHPIASLVSLVGGA
eukprot:1140989-Pelagomonas_calceolata.AAC.11